jgi:nucleoside 2-deoxyribosyltransferase
MSKIYVASSLWNKENVNELYGYLTKNGHKITYDWTTHGQVVGPEELVSIARKEFDGVVDADLLIMLMPARNGSHVEFGVALALGKPIIIVTSDTIYEDKSFYHLDNVHIISNTNGISDLIKTLTENEHD